ncbi:hypothetical protein Dimus_020542 [Dionaea muscipula]
MAGKRGRPRKALALQRGSIVSRRGTTGVFEQIQTEGEEVVDCFAETSRDLGDRLADGEMVDLGDLGNTGGGGEKVVVAEGSSSGERAVQKVANEDKWQIVRGHGSRGGQACLSTGQSTSQRFVVLSTILDESMGDGSERESGMMGSLDRGDDDDDRGSSSGERAVQKVANEDKWQIVRGHGSRGGQACLSTGQSTSQRNQGGFQCKEWKVKEVQGSQTTGLGVQEVGLCFGGQTVGSSSGERAVQKVANEDKWQIVRGHGSRGGQACLSTGQSTSQRFVVLSTILDESMGDGSERESGMMGSLDRGDDDDDRGVECPGTE